MPNRDRQSACKNRRHEPSARALFVKMSATPDQDALSLLEQGDPRGFELLYARYAGRIFSFLIRLSGSRSVAEDLFQHTFLRLAEVGPRLRADSDLRAWLFAVARNAFHSYARSRTTESRARARFLTADAASGSTADARLAVAELERALAAMNTGDRELLLLFAVEGLNYGDVAAVLGLDQATVRKRVSRARARLAEALDEDGTVVSKSRLRE